MRRRHSLLTAVLVAGALLTMAAVAGAFAENATAAWRAPVSGAVVEDFDYHRDTPFERGARRGTRFATRAGETVRVACSGVVSYAGGTPRGQVVSVRCGPLVATHLGLVSVRVGAGDRVRAGSPIARAAGSGVGLGARRLSDRWGYIDPLSLIAAPTPDIGPAPIPRSIARPRPTSARVRIPAPQRVAPLARDTPLVAWGALALMAASLGGVAGGSVRRRWRPSTSPRRSTM